MNSLLANLLTNTAAVDTLRAGLPRAFEMAAVEASRVTLNKRTRLAQSTTGQEVGVLRERVILGYLISQLGEANVKLPAPGVSMVDASLADQPLEIKTVTGSGLVTAKWTSDNESVDQLLEDFAFTSDMLLVRVWWGSDKDSVFYIPVEVLNEVAASFPNYLRSQRGTNNRGVKIEGAFMKQVEGHASTVKVPIHWQRSDQPLQSPIVRYIRYWTELRF